MTIKQCISLITILGLLNGCSFFISEDSPPSALSNQRAKPITTRFKGRIIVGPETQTFNPCDSRSQYALILSPKQYQHLQTKVNYPYQEIYAEILGRLKQPEQRGSAFDFQAALKVNLINFVDGDAIYQCSQPSQYTQAQGRMPNWSVQVSSSSLTVTTPHTAPSKTAITHTQENPASRKYTTAEGELTLTAQLCKLGKNSSLYGWSAEYKDQHGIYTGCGKIGNGDRSKSFAGVYTAQTTSHHNFEITLTLHPDHSAQTTYAYHDGSLPMIETGFWQQMSSKTLQVIMTKHQQQYLPSERIFTVNGSQLHTEQEKIGGKYFPITNGGLTLFKAKEVDQ